MKIKRMAWLLLLLASVAQGGILSSGRSTPVAGPKPAPSPASSFTPVPSLVPARAQVRGGGGQTGSSTAYRYSGTGNYAGGRTAT